MKKTSATESGAVQATAALVRTLNDPHRFPHPTGTIRVIETHVSYVILTGSLAYKIKKPLRFGFLDFTALASRRRACEDELRLNRRTAPELYLRVVPITGPPDSPQLDGVGEAIEYAVEMRQFDPEALLANRIEQGRVEGETIDALAQRVADFHAALERESPVAPPSDAPAGRADAATARKNTAELLGLAIAPELRRRVEALAAWQEAAIERLSPTLRARREAGFVRECHGDLHLSNIALIEGQPVLFDCLEFDRGLRTIDVIDEVSFAFMDLEALGRRDFAYRFLNGYLERTGDYEGVACLRFFALHRALVRAKVGLLRARQPGLDASAAARTAREVERYLAVAETQARTAPRRLVITCGLAGSGKTTVSGHLVEALGAIRLRSDVERKRLAGLAAAARSGSPIAGGLYAPEVGERTYARLEALAETILAAGQSVIADAAFLARRDRDRFRVLARRAGADFAMVVCEAPIDVLRARVEARRARAKDASEADAAVLAHQEKTWEPPAPDELPQVVTISTDRPPAQVREACRALARRP